MSKYFVEKNNESTLRLFNKRFVYKTTVFGSDENNIVSFVDGEKIFYGRINHSFVPITPKHSILKPLTNVNDPEKPLKAVNFVADIFNEMALQFQKCAMQGRIDANDPFLANIRAYSAYTDPKAEYKIYKDIYFDSLKNLFYLNFPNFRNFDEFMTILTKVLKESISTQPFTYTGFVKSRNCSVMNSGLAIEIADSSYINDEEKMNTFIKSKNWQFYVNTCDAYGFMIDYNVPWRIVADIGSEGMLEIAQRYGFINVHHILKDQYAPASKRGIQILGKTMLELYNYIKKDSFYESSVCADGTHTRKIVIPEVYKAEVFFKKYSSEYFYGIYVDLRLQEEQPKMPQHERDIIRQDQLYLFNTSGGTAALHEKFESIINKTFDKRGSLTYNINAEKKKELESFKEESIDNIIITGGENDFSGY
tara:strand:+ start:413 stop:1675 length:1263 start_codon:yes stop_codon:yes gene_type:complete